MGQYLNPDNLGFASAVNSQIYVDKTGMLDYLNQVIGTEQRYVCVSRPRRFGKSIAARMAAAYYSRGCRSEALFSKYEIAKSRDFNTMISPKRLAKYAGFTEDEVRSLCRQYDMNFSEAQRWYDGYVF